MHINICCCIETTVRKKASADFTVSCAVSLIVASDVNYISQCDSSREQQLQTANRVAGHVQETGCSVVKRL